MAVFHQDKLSDERKKEYNLFLKEQGAGLKPAVSERRPTITFKVQKPHYSYHQNSHMHVCVE